MATAAPLPPSSLPGGSTPPPPPGPSSSNDQGQGAASISPISLCLYIFSVTLILFLMILGVFVSRTVRRRRQRSAAVLAAHTTGDSGRTTGLRGKFDKLPASKPVLWETHITHFDDEAKEWAGLLPVAGATIVPVMKAPEHNVKRLASWPSRLRFFPHRNHRPIVADPSPTITSMEPPAPSLEPMHLTYLISMPTPLAPTKAGQGNGGPPVVELGVAHALYTPNVTR